MKCWHTETILPCSDQWKAEKLGAFWRGPITRCFIKIDRASWIIEHSIYFRLNGEHWRAVQLRWFLSTHYITLCDQYLLLSEKGHIVLQIKCANTKKFICAKTWWLMFVKIRVFGLQITWQRNFNNAMTASNLAHCSCLWRPDLRNMHLASFCSWRIVWEQSCSR